MPVEAKYITVNGVMKKNPKYVALGVTPSAPPLTVATAEAIAVNTSNAPLAVVSSVEDVMEASGIQAQHARISVPMADSSASTIEMLQDEDMLTKYKSRCTLDGGELLDKIGEIFAKYETPLGMVNKLMMLTEYNLDFIVDDSRSMSSPTDVDGLDASEPVKSMIRAQLGKEPIPGQKMTRLQEAEDRLHIMIGLLAYIPVEHIQVRFLNARTPLVLDRKEKTPDEFKDYAHHAIRQRFSGLQLGLTPVKEPLQTGFNYPGKWSHYLFNDGEPSEGGRAIADLICRRADPENHALTLISCTDNDRETAWMKLVDELATYVAEVDDYSDERDEVIKKQGAAFPFTRGLWILCQLVASINPFDLDALDENLPFTRHTLNNILGRKLNPDEYQYYFERNPNAELYVYEYARFLNEEVFAKEIICSDVQLARERAAGYVEGERHSRALAPIGAQLAHITEAARRAFIEQYRAEDVPSEAVQLSPQTIAPRAAFMPPPPPYNAGLTAAVSAMSMGSK